MAMISHRESVSSSKPTQTVTDSRMAYSQQQSISSTSHSPSVIATSGTKATSNATGATRTTGKTGPTSMVYFVRIIVLILGGITFALPFPYN